MYSEEVSRFQPQQYLLAHPGCGRTGVHAKIRICGFMSPQLLDVNDLKLRFENFLSPTYFLTVNLF